MYQELEMWKVYQAEKAKQKAEKAKMDLLYAALAECFEMNK